MSKISIDNILYTNNIEQDIKKYLEGNNYSKIFIIVDQNTKKYCLPIIINAFDNVNIIEIKNGDENKSINTAIYIWNYLTENKADRKSLIINLGGGVICDLGGFVASTFKRGIKFINIPTTLLSQVDASIGGKTGINFNSLKNEIGTFYFPDFVFIDAVFLKTIDKQNFLSGFAEIIKHSLIFDISYWNNIKNIDIENIDYQVLNSIILNSINTKKHFVETDPLEQGIRKALNFGHTFGHAFESLSYIQNRPILHGYAVAYGIVCETYLSVLKLKFNYNDYIQISDFIYKLYGKFSLNIDNFELVYNLLLHDKKNSNNQIKLTLIQEKGKFNINNLILKDEIIETLTRYLNN